MATVTPFVEFRSFSGINNVKDWLSLHTNELREAVNVGIDDAGIVSTRDGFIKQQTGDYHSLFADNMLVAVKSGDLVQISDDFTGYSILRAGVGDNPMAYTAINDITYYTNNVVIGYIEGGESKEFGSPTKKGRVTTPAGSLIEYYGGRLYVARGSTIYCTDPMDFKQVDERQGFIQLNGYINTLTALKTGLYVSDGNIRFIGGASPQEFTIKTVARYNAVTAKIVDGSAVGSIDITGAAVYMLTERGFCVGLEEGQFFNLTKNRYTDIQTNTGVCEYIEKNNTFLTISY